jgi:Domain of unknown function (DUF4282)
MQKLTKRVFGSTKPGDIFLDLLTFERLLTKPVIHIIYWAGLLLLCLAAFSVVGGAVGIALKEDQPWGWFLAFPFLIGGMLFVISGMLLWRSFCEFYVAIFRIADDLNYLRNENEGQALRPQAQQPTPAPQAAPSPLSTARAVAGDSRFDTKPAFEGRPAAESRPFPGPISVPEQNPGTSRGAEQDVFGDPLPEQEAEDPFFRRVIRKDDL